MATNDDIATMSDEDLMSQWTALGERVQADRERLVAFNQEHQHRIRLAEMERLMNLTPEQAEAALNAISVTPSGIESQEAVGDQPEVPNVGEEANV